MIFTYNKEFVGDVLMVIVANNEDAKLSVERKGNIARIFREDTAETVAWNIFQVSDILNIQQSGQIFLTDEEDVYKRQFIDDLDMRMRLFKFFNQAV